MCQVIPFTLPCCRRTYVEVSRLPSCPDSWPSRKCPPELCIQVRGYEAEDRNTGTCWRCKALEAGKSGFERERLRPEIDQADIVHGLEELGVSGRRQRMEEGGKCWYCGAQGNCEACGTKQIEPADVVTKQEVTSKKRPRDAGVGRGKGVNKRVKIECKEPQALASASTFTYPDPEIPSNWQHNDPQPRSQQPGPIDFLHDGLPLSNEHGTFGAGGSRLFPGPWQAAHNEREGLLPTDYSSDQVDIGQDRTSNKDFKYHPSPNTYPSYPGLDPQLGFAGSQSQDHFENLDTHDAVLAQMLETYNKEQSDTDYKPGLPDETTQNLSLVGLQPSL